MALVNADIDGVFRALADGTRRAVVAELACGPRSVSALAAPFEMALPSFVRHLAVLEQAGLVTSEKKGRVRTCRLAPAALEAAQTWIETQRSIWEQRLDRLDDYVLALHAREGDDDDDST